MKRKSMMLCLFAAVFSVILSFAVANADFLRMDSADASSEIYDAEGIYKLAEAATFYLRVLREDGSVQAVGTGVTVSSDGKAVSAYHVVEGGKRFEAMFNNGIIATDIEIIASDEWKDTAILQIHDFATAIVEESPVRYLPIRQSAVRYGEKIFALGYPLKNTPLITEGIINSPKAEINGRNRVLVSAQVAGGMSGGPIIDQQGYVAGIISGSLRTMNNIHLVIDMDDVLSMLTALFGQGQQKTEQ